MSCKNNIINPRKLEANMNQVEYTAIVTMIQALKSQIAGLETVIATIANVSREKQNPTRIVPKNQNFTDSSSLTEEEEIALEKMMKEAEETQLKRMEQEAKKHFEANMQQIADSE